MDVSDIIFKTLVKQNVKNVFFYPGGSITPLLKKFYKQSYINYYVNSSESHSLSSAIGYSKAKRFNEVGVVITSTGPSLTNCISNLLDSKFDGTPIILISGQVPLKLIGTGCFQESPSVDITKHITKKSYFVKNKYELPKVLNEAFRLSLSNKKGPVHIDIPSCIIKDTFDKGQDTFDKGQDTFDKGQDTFDKGQDNIYSLINNLNRSEKPVFLIGKGAYNARNIIKKIAYKSKIPVANTLLGSGIFHYKSHLCLKMTGLYGTPQANNALHNSDLIICVGARLEDRCVGSFDFFGKNAKYGVYNINNYKYDFNKTIKNTINILGDSFDVLNYIEPFIKTKSSRKEWISNINEWKQIYKFDKEKFYIYLNDIIKTLNNIIIVTGVGNHQMFVSHYIDFTNDIQLITSGGYGNMESCLGNAIGAKIACKNKKIICIVGDGTFNMCSSELITIMKYNLDIKIFIINNSSLDMVSRHQDLHHESKYIGSDLKNPDYILLGRSFNINSISIDIENEIESKLKETILTSLNFQGPFIINVISKNSFCFPILKQNSPLNELIFKFQM
jgi:acetolactate synthase-1/2/3 large subunit